MVDERQFRTQELTSAKYLVQAEESAEPEVEAPARRVQPRRSGLENAVRWLTPLVVIMLVAAAGGLYWQNRASIASTAGELKKRRCVVDLLLWASGSKKTFNQALSDKIKSAQRDSAFQFDQTKPAFKTEFDNVDFQNLSESWNGTPWNGNR
jgi:hypothetical protein